MSNDIKEVSIKTPSITLGDRANVQIAEELVTATTQRTAAVKPLVSIVSERKAWETNAYSTSNKQLYAVLAMSYAFYLATKGDSDAAKGVRAELTAFIAQNNLRFTESSHGITKVLKCVFFDGANSVDRRRISTYSIVLRAALTQQLKAEEIAAFIENNGGVQELRLAKSLTAKTAKQRAALGRDAVGQANILATFSSAELSRQIDSTEFDTPMAAIIVARPNGTVEVRGLVKSKGAVNAALVGYVSANKDKAAKEAAQKEVAQAAASTSALIAKAAQAVAEAVA